MTQRLPHSPFTHAATDIAQRAPPLRSNSRKSKNPSPSPHKKVSPTRKKTPEAPWLLEEATAWDQQHHVAYSRDNSKFNPSLREFFPPADAAKAPPVSLNIHPASISPLQHTRQSILEAPTVPQTDVKFEVEHILRVDPLYTGTMRRDKALALKDHKTGVRAQWNSRWNVSVSKDNSRLHANDRELFERPANFTSRTIHSWKNLE